MIIHIAHHATSKALPTPVHAFTVAVGACFHRCSVRYFIALLVIKEHSARLYSNVPSTRGLAILRSINCLTYNYGSRNFVLFKLI